ncbi:MAG: DUF2142 domain-containing protein [Propionibacteriaceae bacterium]|nr:DUF2142 domain-containing protein [Propionibacteriaceae bacterium]
MWKHARAWVAAILAIVGGGATVFAWAVASPVGASPDEDYHLASIWCPAIQDGSCSTRTTSNGTVEVAVPAQVVESSGCFQFHSDVSGACTTHIPDQTVWTTRVNKGHYPGGYYSVMHLFVGPDVYHSVIVMRVVNGAIAMVLIGLVVIALPRSGRRLLVYSTLPVCVPLMVYLLASVNPSGWALTGVTVAWFGTYASVVASSRVRTVLSGLLAVVGAAMAASARSDAGVYVCGAVVVAVILFGPKIRRNWWTIVLLVLMVVIGIAGFLSGNQSAAVSPSTVSTNGSLLVAIASVVLSPLFMIDFGAGFFGLNWDDTAMPALVWVPVAILAIGLMILGLRRLNWRKLLAFGGVFFVYMALPTYLFAHSGQLLGHGVQPRYVAPLLPLLLSLALWRPERGGAKRLSLVPTIILSAGLVVAHTVALHVQIRRFVSGLDVSSLNLNSSVQWWHAGPSPLATWLIGAVGFAMVAATLFILRRGGGPRTGDVTLDSPASGQEELGQVRPVPVSN